MERRSTGASPRVRLASAGALTYLLAMGLVGVRLANGGTNVTARGWAEVIDGLLCFLVVVSFGMRLGSVSRRYFQLLQGAMAMFAVSFIAGGAVDLGGSPGLDPVAGATLVVGAAILILAVAVYVGEHKRVQQSVASLLELAIIVVAVLALLAPLVLYPLALDGGVRSLATGLAWTAELGLFIGSLWIAVDWLKPAEQMDFVILIGALGGALLLATIHVGFDLVRQPSVPWWLQALYGPGLLVLVIAPELGLTPAGVLTRNAEWSSLQAYLPYVPVVPLLGVVIGMAISGELHGALGRGLVAGALTVSVLLVARQSVLLHDHRRMLTQRSLQALRDPLTGLLNRRAFDEDLAQLLYQSRRDETVFATVLIDVDGLKRINDGPGGHAAGDLALRAIATAVFGAGRREDRAYRLGGDEFAILLPSAGRSTALGSLARARGSLASSTAGVTFSSGTAVFPRDGGCESALCQAADSNLYRSKAKSVRTPASLPIGARSFRAE